MNARERAWFENSAGFETPSGEVQLEPTKAPTIRRSPEELKAKNEAEEKASQARHAEAAKRMAAEREAVGYDPLRSGVKE